MTSPSAAVVVGRLPHLVGHVGDDAAGVGVDHDERAAPAAPAQRGAEQPVAEAPPDRRCRGRGRRRRTAPRGPSSQAAGDSTRTPSTVPPQASTDCTRATERALPKPLAAGTCARRQATLLPSRTRTGVGGPVPAPSRPVRCPAAGEVRRGAGDPVLVLPGRRDGQGDAGVVLRRRARSRSPRPAARRPRRRRTADAAPGGPPHQLAEQVPLGEGVVAGRGARGPARRGGREPRGRRGPVVQLLDRDPPSPAGPAVCDSTCRRSTPSLPAAANSGQDRATGASRSSRPRSTSTSAHSAVMVLVTDHTPVRVPACPGPGPAGVGGAAPDVDHAAAVHAHGHRAADVALVEQRRQAVGDGGEGGVAGALEVGHGSMSPHRRPARQAVNAAPGTGRAAAQAGWGVRSTLVSGRPLASSSTSLSR